MRMISFSLISWSWIFHSRLWSQDEAKQIARETHISFSVIVIVSLILIWRSRRDEIFSSERIKAFFMSDFLTRMLFHDWDTNRHDKRKDRNCNRETNTTTDETTSWPQNWNNHTSLKICLTFVFQIHFDESHLLPYTCSQKAISFKKVNVILSMPFVTPDASL